MSRVTIIAEAGVNHNGQLGLAEELIKVAADAGADYVKFQTFKANKLVSKTAQKAEYQKKSDSDGSQMEMLKKLELSKEDHHVLKKSAETKGIKFLSTGFDEDSIDFLDELGIDLYKIPSGEITNKPYLQHIAGKSKRIVLSTGMADMDEIREALDALYEAGADRNRLTVLHCNTEYPTPMKDVNMKAMLTIQKEFGVEVGYSDHTLGIEVSLAAVSLGASVIEKHFTLDRSLKGPDHAASLDPRELKDLVTSVRNIEIALSGSGEKQPSVSEIKNIAIARKSVHSANSLKKGSVVARKDLIMLRPGDGISPMRVDELIGKTTLRDIEQFKKLSRDDLSG